MQGRWQTAGAFPTPQKARVAWIGVQADGLAALAADVRTRLEGIGRDEHRDFVAHVTLGRFRRPQDVRGALPHVQPPQGVVPLQQVELMRSQLTPNGPEYRPISTWPLDGSG